MKIAALVLLCCLPAFAQNPDTAKYAPRQILLVDPTLGSEAILPMLVPADGQERLEFVPTSKLKEFLDKGGRVVRLADILTLLGDATEKANKLQAENEKLWKVAMKSESVVVQPSQPSQAELAPQIQAETNARRQQMLQTLLILNSANRQPYQVPMPVNPNSNRLQTNCTTYRLGDMTHTNCN